MSKIHQPMPAALRCLILGLLGGGASVTLALLFGAFAGAGHGSAVPFETFAAPCGLGMFVLPISFAAMGLPRRWLWWALAIVVALLLVRAAGAYWIMLYGPQDAGRLGGLEGMANALHALNAILSIISPICILARIVAEKPQGNTIGMNQVGK